VNKSSIARSLAFVLATGVVFAMSGAASADTIGINFSGGFTMTPPWTALDTDVNPLEASDSAGVVAQTNWNNLAPHAGSASNIINGSGNSVGGVTVAWDGFANWAVVETAQTDPNKKLMNGYLDMEMSVRDPNYKPLTTVTVSNIPYARYDVYAYVGADVNGRSGHGWISTPSNPNDALTDSAYFTTNDSPFGGFVKATGTGTGDANSSNYLMFAGLSAANFQFNLTGNNNASHYNVGLHGIQIIGVPEPAVGALAATGMLALLAYAWRKRK
jgi:hypothetical protein